MIKSGSNAYVYIGPTSPNPGPTLPRVAATLDKAVIISIPYAVISRVETIKIAIYPMKNPITPFRTSSGIVSSPTFIDKIAFGCTN
ncbi:MAG: hypothetical protein AMQ22_01997 [Candidatus Methanofastidiosum methylothiophilum]|uniref:Uncharacterized protein n=1 Tax=Candidatus Methanofastidiosum methylothiophilum TaxID=1705564 RepID=A0A150IQL0_9EURY|nr:MAG: hypothetical protein AMQ22_01997 [Candidatus Methanofastidiosum methylthiophilus]